MSDSVGKISLDLELQSDLGKQIEATAVKMGEQIKASLQNIGNFDFSKMTSSLSDVLKVTMDKALSGVNVSVESTFNTAADIVSETINIAKENALAAIAEIKRAATEMMQGVAAMSKNIKIPMNFPKPVDAQTPNSVPAISPTIPRAPPIPVPSVKMPKIDTGINIEALNAQIINLSQSLDITNSRIEQQKEKLAQLKESYNRAFDGTKKNKLQEQILQTEAAINKLTAVSDKTGFKLADLDEQFRLLSGSAKDAMSGINVVNNKLKETANVANKSSKNLLNLGKSAKESNNDFNRMHYGLGMIMRQFFTWMVVLPLVMKGLTGMATFLGQAFMANTQFANSLNQIKSNLYTAFMPIYQAVLPAINALMAGLSRITAYIASFTSTLFGKTYNQSFQAAKGLIAAKTEMGAYGNAAKKAAKDAKGALAGFDEINQLQLGKGSDDSAGGSDKIPKMVMPSVDTSTLDKSMGVWADKFKKVLGTIFQPFKNAWQKDRAGVTAEFKNAIEGSKATLGNFFNMLATPPVQKFLENIGSLVLSTIKLGLKIYDGFILPIVNWFIGILPGAANGLNPILEVVTKFVNYLSGDGFKFVQIFISTLSGLFIAFKVFNLIQMARAGIEAFTGVLKYNWAVLAANPIVAVIALIAGLAVAFGILYASNEKFRNIVNGVGNTISKFFTPILKALKDAFLDIWNNALVPLGKVLEELGSMIITPLAKIFKDVFAIAIKFVADVGKDLWNLVLVPLGSFIKDIFIKIIQSAIEIFHAWKPAIQLVIDVIMFLWANVLRPLISFLGGVFIGTFQGVFTSIGDLIGGIKKIFSGIIDFVTGVFTGNWRRAWEGVKEVFAGIANTFGAIMKAPLNAVIGLINGAISSINKIKVPKIDLPFGMGTVGGWNISIPKIPYLAKGGVIDQPTLAMVGERGKEAVMPLENNTGWITQLAGQIAEILGANKGQNNTTTTDRPIEIVIQLGGYEFTRFIINSINALQRKTGKTLLEV